MSASDVQDRVHRGGATVEVNGHDRLRARGDGLLDEAGIDVECVLVDVHEDRFRAYVAYRLCACEEAERGRYHLVADAYPNGSQGDHERVGAAVDANGVLRAQVGTGLLLEGGDLRTADELAAPQHALEGLVQLVPVDLDLGTQVQDGDGLGGRGAHAILRTSDSLTFSYTWPRLSVAWPSSEKWRASPYALIQPTIRAGTPATIA